ncbi:hypothetical protein PG984_015997 [Apiospora sp. TS-2023a]
MRNAVLDALQDPVHVLRGNALGAAVAAVVVHLRGRRDGRLGEDEAGHGHGRRSGGQRRERLGGLDALVVLAGDRLFLLTLVLVHGEVQVRVDRRRRLEGERQDVRRGGEEVRRAGYDDGEPAERVRGAGAVVHHVALLVNIERKVEVEVVGLLWQIQKGDGQGRQGVAADRERGTVLHHVALLNDVVKGPVEVGQVVGFGGQEHVVGDADFSTLVHEIEAKIVSLKWKIICESFVHETEVKIFRLKWEIICQALHETEVEIVGLKWDVVGQRKRRQEIIGLCGQDQVVGGHRWQGHGAFLYETKVWVEVEVVGLQRQVIRNCDRRKDIIRDSRQSKVIRQAGHIYHPLFIRQLETIAGFQGERDCQGPAPTHRDGRNAPKLRVSGKIPPVDDEIVSRRSGSCR